MSDIPLAPIEQAPPPAPPAPPPRSAVHKIFFNDVELRAGWRLLIFFCIFLAISFGLRMAAKLMHRPRPPQLKEITTNFLLVGEGVAFLILLAATAIMSRIERRPMRVYGLSVREAFCKNFWVGALWGWASLTVLLLILRGSHAFYFGVPILHGADVAKYAVLLGIGFIFVGLSEEYSLRGYFQFTATTGMGFWPAAVLTSAIFTALHTGNPGENKLGLLEVFLIGMFFCLTLRRTGSLWWAIGYHAGWDWSQSYLYGTPDSGMLAHGRLMASSHAGPDWLSGGTVGPEGSVLTVVIYAIVVVLFHLVYKGGAKYPDPAGLKTVASETSPTITQVA